jgi:hypothetical protein
MNAPTRWIGGAAIVFALVLMAPVIAVEFAYRWGLHRVGELPQLPGHPVVLRLHRAFWAADEGGEMAIEPQWPWTVIGNWVRVTHQRPQSVRLPAGTSLADSIARRWLGARLVHPRALEYTLQRASIGIWLSRNASTEQVLVAFADSVYLGHGMSGAPAASHELFGIEPEHLTWAQAALLAGLVQSPSSYDPRCHAERALKRRQWVLLRLLEQAVMSRAEFDEAATSPVALAASSTQVCPQSLKDDDE